MPKNNPWLKRKYIYEKNKAKNLCQIYKIQVFEHGSNQHELNCSQFVENGSRAIRVDKGGFKQEVPAWAQVNQRQQFGYLVLPESPVSYFNEQEGRDFCSYEDQMNGKFYNWQNVDTNEDWDQYQY